MKDWPQQAWAILLAMMGATVAIIVLFSPAAENIKLGVLAVASSLASGAVGYIGGHAAGSKANPTAPE